jgi:hypothetical protein
MVAVLYAALLAQAEAPAAGPVELDPVTRGRLMMALLAIALMGAGLIVIVILGARMVRRRLRLPPLERRETPLPPKRIFRTGQATDDAADDDHDDDHDDTADHEDD